MVKGVTRTSKPRSSRGGKTFDPADVEAAAVLILADQPVLIGTDFGTIGAAQSDGYRFRNLVGAHIGLPTNDKGGYPALTAQTFGVPADFDADAADPLAAMIPARVGGKVNPDAATFAVLIDRTGNWSDADVPKPVEEKPKPKPRSSK